MDSNLVCWVLGLLGGWVGGCLGVGFLCGGCFWMDSNLGWWVLGLLGVLGWWVLGLVGDPPFYLYMQVFRSLGPSIGGGRWLKVLYNPALL